MWVTLLLTLLRALVVGAWFLIKPILGWTLIVIGLIGMPMPIMNGVIFLVIGLALVGHRNWVIRWSRIQIKLLLQRWAAMESPLIGPIGRLARRSAQELSRRHRRMRWWLAERRLRPRAAPDEPAAVSGPGEAA